MLLESVLIRADPASPRFNGSVGVGVGVGVGVVGRTPVTGMRTSGPLKLQPISESRHGCGVPARNEYAWNTPPTVISPPG